MRPGYGRLLVRQNSALYDSACLVRRVASDYRILRGVAEIPEVRAPAVTRKVGLRLGLGQG